MDLEKQLAEMERWKHELTVDLARMREEINEEKNELERLRLRINILGRVIQDNSRSSKAREYDEEHLIPLREARKQQEETIERLEEKFDNDSWFLESVVEEIDKHIEALKIRIKQHS